MGFIRDSLSTNDLCCCLDILVNDVISEDIELLFNGIVIFRIASVFVATAIIVAVTCYFRIVVLF